MYASDVKLVTLTTTMKTNTMGNQQQQQQQHQLQQQQLQKNQLQPQQQQQYYSNQHHKEQQEKNNSSKQQQFEKYHSYSNRSYGSNTKGTKKQEQYHYANYNSSNTYANNSINRRKYHYTQQQQQQQRQTESQPQQQQYYHQHQMEPSHYHLQQTQQQQLQLQQQLHMNSSSSSNNSDGIIHSNKNIYNNNNNNNNSNNNNNNLAKDHNITANTPSSESLQHTATQTVANKNTNSSHNYHNNNNNNTDNDNLNNCHKNATFSSISRHQATSNQQQFQPSFTFSTTVDAAETTKIAAPTLLVAVPVPAAHFSSNLSSVSDRLGGGSGVGGARDTANISNINAASTNCSIDDSANANSNSDCTSCSTNLSKLHLQAHEEQTVVTTAKAKTSNVAASSSASSNELQLQELAVATGKGKSNAHKKKSHWKGNHNHHHKGSNNYNTNSYAEASKQQQQQQQQQTQQQQQQQIQQQQLQQQQQKSQLQPNHAKQQQSQQQQQHQQQHQQKQQQQQQQENSKQQYQQATQTQQQQQQLHHKQQYAPQQQHQQKQQQRQQLQTQAPHAATELSKKWSAAAVGSSSTQTEDVAETTISVNTTVMHPISSYGAPQKPPVASQNKALASAPATAPAPATSTTACHIIAPIPVSYAPPSRATLLPTPAPADNYLTTLPTTTATEKTTLPSANAEAGAPKTPTVDPNQATAKATKRPGTPNSYTLDFLHSVGVQMGVEATVSTPTFRQCGGGSSISAASYDAVRIPYQYTSLISNNRTQRYMPTVNSSTGNGVGGGGGGSPYHHHHHHPQPQQLTIASFIQGDLLGGSILGNAPGVGGGGGGGGGSGSNGGRRYETSHNTYQHSQSRYNNFYPPQYAASHHQQQDGYGTLQHGYATLNENFARVASNGGSGSSGGGGGSSGGGGGGGLSNMQRHQSYQKYNHSGASNSHSCAIGTGQQSRNQSYYQPRNESASNVNGNGSSNVSSNQNINKKLQPLNQSKKSNSTLLSSSSSSLSISSGLQVSAGASYQQQQQQQHQQQLPKQLAQQQQQQPRQSASSQNLLIEATPLPHSAPRKSPNYSPHPHQQIFSHQQYQPQQPQPPQQQQQTVAAAASKQPATTQTQNLYGLTYAGDLSLPSNAAMPMPMPMSNASGSTSTASLSACSLSPTTSSSALTASNNVAVTENSLENQSLWLDLSGYSRYHHQQQQQHPQSYQQHAAYVNNNNNRHGITSMPSMLRLNAPTLPLQLPTLAQLDEVVAAVKATSATAPSASNVGNIAAANSGTATPDSGRHSPLSTAATAGIVRANNGSESDASSTHSLGLTQRQQQQHLSRHLKPLSQSSCSSASSTTSLPDCAAVAAVSSFAGIAQLQQQQSLNNNGDCSPRVNELISMLHTTNKFAEEELPALLRQHQIYCPTEEQLQDAFAAARIAGERDYWGKSPRSSGHLSPRYSDQDDEHEPHDGATSSSSTTSANSNNGSGQKSTRSQQRYAYLQQQQLQSALASGSLAAIAALRARSRHKQQFQQQLLVAPQTFSYPPHNLLFSSVQPILRRSAVAAALDLLMRSPSDRFMARADAIETKIAPGALLNGTQWDTLSHDIWMKFASSQQTSATYQDKMRLWRYLFIIIKLFIFPFQNTHLRYGLYLVGSTISGFGSDSSDIDMCLVSRGPSSLDPRLEALLNLTVLRDCLQKSGEFEDFNLIEAKVPILRFRDRGHHMEIDLNFNNSVGIKNTHLLYCYSQLDWRLRPMVLVTKLWAQYHNINNAKDMTISSYSLVLMVIHFLQYAVTPPVLPCLHDMFPDKFTLLRSNDFGKIDLNENMEPYDSKNTQTLGELFLCFLEYYSCFDYTQFAISVRTGGLLPINVCRQARSMKNDIHQWKELCIEEPFDLTNTARSVYDCETFARVKAVFVASWRKLRETLDLQSIFAPLSIPTLSPPQPTAETAAITSTIPTAIAKVFTESELEPTMVGGFPAAAVAPTAALPCLQARPASPMTLTIMQAQAQAGNGMDSHMLQNAFAAPTQSPHAVDAVEAMAAAAAAAAVVDQNFSSAAATAGNSNASNTQNNNNLHHVPSTALIS